LEITEISQLLYHMISKNDLKELTQKNKLIIIICMYNRNIKNVITFYITLHNIFVNRS